MKYRNLLKSAIGLVTALATSPLLPGQSVTLGYPSTRAEIANPERGWYDDYYSYSGGATLGTTYRPLQASEMVANRENDHITLILRLFYLHEFLEEDSVSQEYLERMQSDFDSVRAAGVKCIVRFAYSASQSAAVWDATPEKVFSHIASLGDILAVNGDVIAGVQAGFIGAWGEWYYTKNFAGPSYQPDETDQQNRRTLVEKLLTILPLHVSVAGRTPAIMKNIVGTGDPITEAEAFDGSFKSRTGHHNDCFLADASDYGTYTNLAADLAYLHETTKYTITGGETCDASNHYSDCADGVPRMTELHWTYLNRDYNRAVYSKWEEQGCYDAVNISLGYRIHLDSATLATGAGRGSSMPLSFTFQNVGYAAPTQYKPIQVVLIHAVTSAETILEYTGTNDDIRFWLPGRIVLEGSVEIPAGLDDGNYSMALRFPDRDPELATNPAYSIRLANVGTWDAARGINLLHHMVTIGAGGEGALPLAPEGLTGTTVSESEIALNWTDQSDNETGFEIMRAVGDEMAWETAAVTGPGSETYNDQSLSKGKLYHYMVRAINTYGSSPLSESISVYTHGVGLDPHHPLEAGIYPNPLSRGDLTITFSGTSERRVIITSLSGARVFEVTTLAPQVRIPREMLHPGLFMITLVQGNLTRSDKIVVL
jgi:hypothetical protein